jgi:hypothetical protein
MSMGHHSKPAKLLLCVAHCKQPVNSPEVRILGLIVCSNFQCVATYQSYCTQASLTAYAIQVRWQSSDLPSLETNPVVAIQTGPAPILTAPSTNQTTHAPPAVHESGISVGAKAGIGVGIAVAIAIIALLSFFLFRLRRKARSQAPAFDMRATPDPNIAMRPYIEPRVVDNSTAHTISNAPVEVPADPLSPEDEERQRRRMELSRMQERRARLMRVQELNQEERSRLHNLDQLDDEIARAQAELEHRPGGPGRW